MKIMKLVVIMMIVIMMIVVMLIVIILITMIVILIVILIVISLIRTPDISKTTHKCDLEQIDPFLEGQKISFLRFSRHPEVQF